MRDHFLCRYRDLFAAGIERIENETAIRAGKAVQSENVLLLLQESPHLGLFPAPALSQGFQSEKNPVFTVLANRGIERERITGLSEYRVAPEIQPCVRLFKYIILPD